MKTKFIILSLALSVSSMAQAAGEKIMGVTINDLGIQYQVYSGGCTSKKDFTVQILESNPVQLVLERNKVDACEAYLPYGTLIQFTWKELGLANGAEAIIKNDLATVQSPYNN